MQCVALMMNLKHRRAKHQRAFLKSLSRLEVGKDKGDI